MSNWRFFLSFDSEIREIPEPIKFDEVEFIGRRMENHGMDQIFGSDLVFDSKTAAWIQAIYDVHFINASIGFQIQSDVNLGTENYEYDGFLDLSTWSQNNVCDVDSYEITTGILQDDIREKFKARQDVEIDLLNTKDLDQNTIPELTLRTVRLHCQELYLKGQAETIAEVGEAFDNENAVYPLYWQNSDFKGVFGNSLDPTGFSFVNTNVIFQNNSDFTRDFTISEARFKFNVFNPHQPGPPTDPDCGFTLNFIIFDDTHVISSSVPFAFFNVLSGTTHFFDVTVTNFDFTLPPGYSFMVALTLDTGIFWALNILEADLPDNYLTLTELNSSAYASLCDGLTIEEFLRRCIYIITGDPDGLVSDYFSEMDDGCQWNNLITTGLYIRNANLINSQPGLKTSFKKFFDSLSAIFCLGWQFEQAGYNSYKIRIEPADYFYSTDQLAEFNDVEELKQNAMSDKLVNSIELGYSDNWRNIAVSGIWSIHTNRNYFVKNKATKNGSTARFEKKSDIIAEGYAIEFSRRLQFLRDDSGSSDRPNDYNFFIIWLNRDEVNMYIEDSGYQLPGEAGLVTFAPGTVSYGSNFIAESNAPIDRIYNVFHSPVRVASRWWKILGMHVYGLQSPDNKLFFQAGEYFTSYSSRIDSTSAPEECLENISDGALLESSDISIEILNADYQRILFAPVELLFSSPQALCNFINMANPGNGYIKVTIGNTTRYGYITEVSNEPESEKGGVTNFKLILAQGVPILGAFSDGFSDGFLT